MFRDVEIKRLRGMDFVAEACSVLSKLKTRYGCIL
jgi:hypothetical protein